MIDPRKRPNRLNVDLQGYKDPWVKLCQTRGVTPSDAIRELIARELVKDEGGQSNWKAVQDSPDDGERIRKEIRFTQSEYEAAEKLAFQEGLPFTRWVVSLVRARLTGSPQFTQPELEELAKSNLRLLALGRNLNQIARALNSTPHDREAYRLDLVEEIAAAVKSHAKKVATVMSANVNRWKLK